MTYLCLLQIWHRSVRSAAVDGYEFVPSEKPGM